MQEALNNTSIGSSLAVMHLLSDDNKDHFYKDLQAVVEGLNRLDLVIITSDMNANTGGGNEDMELLMAKHARNKKQ